MPTDKPQLSVALPEDDYRWLQEEASRAGISKSGVLRQALSLYQATGGLLGPVRLEMTEQVYAAGREQDANEEQSEDENNDSERGLDSFKRDS